MTKTNFDAHRAATLRRLHDERQKAAAEAKKAEKNAELTAAVAADATADFLAQRADDVALIESQVNG